MAEVTLVFDNSNKIFPSEFNEIQITRKVYRNSSENEYYINKSRVRLKDIQNLVMDTGLSKGSLAIISQGNVSKFADSRPEERRVLFEEAAGVAKYKKRKEEGLRKLDRTNENLNRVNDILTEVSRKIEPLKKQAVKAKEYIKIRDTLKKYEITLLVKDGAQFQNDLSNLSSSILSKSKTQSELSLKINNFEQRLKILKNKSYEVDKNINSLEMNLSNINTLLSILEQQKKIMEDKIAEQKNKKTNNSEIDNIKNKIEEILTLISQKEIIKNKEVQKLNELKVKLDTLTISSNDLVISQNNLHHSLGQKKASLNYISLNQQKQKQKYLGVQTVLNNKSNLYGIVDTISNLIDVPEFYHQAVGVILGKNLQNIVAKTDKDVTKAVNFLKENKSGVATFLPLNTLQVRLASSEDEIVVSSQKGFIGFANKLVKVLDPTCSKAIDFLLARTVICEDLESARVISKLISAKYQCVSLDGQLIKAGGAIVGGFLSNNSNVDLLKKDDNSDFLEEEIKNLEQELVNVNVQNSALQSEINNFQAEKAKLEVSVNKLGHEINDFQNRSQLLTTQYQTLTGQKIVLENNQQLNDIFVQYETNKYEQENINNQLKVLRNQKNQLIEDMQTIENDVYLLHQEEYKINGDLNNEKLQQVQLENKVEQILKRLVETYHLTFDYAKEIYNQELENEQEARELVFKLRNDLEDLGFVNINAIEEYEQENERFEELNSKHEELTVALNELLKAIDEMDSIMVEKFDETIKNINNVLPETFKTLFGGGSCELRYNDPNNILETGVEVLANPPGKKISNLNLLSGGEKSLVALAVLFAILKVKPLPLTILDEVEAPLDPANLERFARYVRKFSETTQFIIVTHRPGTMENCDVLYGTTMENQGITKMVNIKLTDAKKMVINEEGKQII